MPAVVGLRYYAANVPPPPSPPLLLVVDGNSMLHRAYHAAATGRVEDPAGRPVWAVKGLVGYVARAAALLRPDAVLVGFDCPEQSARRVDYPAYKGHRPAKAEDLVEQLLRAPELLATAGLCTVVPPAYEADDVLASAAAQARGRGWRAVVMTSDRDAFALLDASTSVLRVRNGGFDNAVLMTAQTLTEAYGVRPEQYRDYAALRGDPSDNLPGVRGFGSATAARLLAAFGTVEAAWAALDRGEVDTVRAVVGEAAVAHLAAPAMRERVHRNRRIMLMRADLPLPDLDSARVPIGSAILRGVLRRHGIILGPSLWALTGGAPPVGEPPVTVHPFVRPRRPRLSREPLPGQLSLF
jgi:5'-3' exonuclease